MAQIDKNIRIENLRILKQLEDQERDARFYRQREQLKIRLFNEIGEMLVRAIRAEMLVPRMRFTKRPRMAKAKQYNTKASGALRNSVSYQLNLLDDDQIEIDILMLDYGVDNVYGDGSFPGGGNWAKDTRPKEARAERSALIEALTKWAGDKLGLTGAKAKSMAFAVRKNLFKYGYGGIELYNPTLQKQVVDRALQLLERAPFDALPVEDEVKTLFDKINTFGNRTYTLTI